MLFYVVVLYLTTYITSAYKIIFKKSHIILITFRVLCRENLEFFLNIWIFCLCDNTLSPQFLLMLLSRTLEIVVNIKFNEKLFCFFPQSLAMFLT